MKLILMIILGAQARAATVVVSDLHLPRGQFAYAKFVDYVAAHQSEISDIVVNGDIYDAPALTGVAWTDRRQMTVKILRDLARATGAKVHFNFGNHDLWLIKSLNEEDAEYTRELRAALELAGVAVIGTDWRATYDYMVGGQRLRIGHAPFAKSAGTIAQSARYAINPRAVQKVTDVPLTVTRRENFIYVMSDSHTPLADVGLGVFNTGKMTADHELPGAEKTFLVIRNGQGRLMEIEPTGKISELDLDCVSALTK